MKDWKAMVKAQGLDIKDAEIERIEPLLDSLETAFRPLPQKLPLAMEPAVIFRCPKKEELR